MSLYKKCCQQAREALLGRSSMFESSKLFQGHAVSQLLDNFDLKALIVLFKSSHSFVFLIECTCNSLGEALDYIVIVPFF